MTQHHLLKYDRAYLHNGGNVYTIVDKANGEDGLDMNWEMLENELPSPEQSPTHDRNNKCGNELDTRPSKNHRSSLLQAIHHEYTCSEDENIADEVNPPEFAPRVDRPAKVLWPEDDEAKHAGKTSRNTKSGSIPVHNHLLFPVPYFM